MEFGSKSSRWDPNMGSQHGLNRQEIKNIKCIKNEDYDHEHLHDKWNK